MSGLTFTPDPSPSMPDKPLADPSVGVELVGGTVGYDGQQKLAGVQFGFGVQANASIAAFNSLDDKDQDGVLGVPIKDDDVFKIILPPQIELTENDAWLKYRASAKVKVSVSGEVSPIAFKLDASKEAIFTDFHVHARTENTRKAVVSDISQLRFAADPKDVLKIGNKEALSYQVRGELSASVTLSWSDVLTASLSSLSQFLKSGTMLALKITPSASVTFRLGLIDDFRIVFTKGLGSKIRVAVKKSNTREVGLSAELGVTVKFADEKAVKDILTKVLEPIAGKSISTIDNIFKKATFEDLSAAERKIVDELIKRLGLEDIAHSLADLKKRWEALKKKVEGTIDQIAKAKIALGFAYEYLRTRTEDSLLIAELDSDILKKFHNDLMLCDLIKLLDWVANNPDANALVKYINQKTLTRSQAWGFSLGIGPWNVGGKDKLELTSIVQRNLQGDERIAYKGLRGYDGTWVGDKANWNVDFKAEMEGFAKKGAATACQFKYGLHFKWLWDEKKLKQEELQSYLDYAVIWRVITQDNAREALELVKDNFGQKAQVGLELTFDDDAFRALLPLAAGMIDGDLPVLALAKSMPYVEMYEGRRSPANREIIYAPLWKYYFQNDSRPINTFPAVAAHEVETITQLKHIADGPGLALRERGTSPSLPAYQDFYTFSGQIYSHGQTPNDYSGIHRNWLSFASGLKQLNSALQPDKCAPHKRIEEIFKLLAKFWGQTLYVRAAGVFLMDVASTDKSIFQKIKSSFTISIKDGDVYAFGSSM